MATPLLGYLILFLCCFQDGLSRSVISSGYQNLSETSAQAASPLANEVLDDKSLKDVEQKSRRAGIDIVTGVATPNHVVGKMNYKLPAPYPPKPSKFKTPKSPNFPKNSKSAINVLPDPSKVKIRKQPRIVQTPKQSSEKRSQMNILPRPATSGLSPAAASSSASNPDPPVSFGGARESLSADIGPLALGPSLADLGTSLGESLSSISSISSGVPQTSDNAPPPGIIFGNNGGSLTASSAVEFNPYETSIVGSNPGSSLNDTGSSADQLPFEVHVSDPFLAPPSNPEAAPAAVEATTTAPTTQNVITSTSASTTAANVSQTPAATTAKLPVINEQPAQWFWPDGHHTGPLVE